LYRLQQEYQYLGQCQYFSVGMLATNSIMGGVLQVINFFIVFFIWVPFLKIMDIQNLRAEKE
jgi:hypothetical protein